MPVTFALAGRQDEADIRRLLRENPLGGAWRLSLEREPDGFAGPHMPQERQHFVLARESASGEAIGLCERVVRPAFVNGAERMLPYLGALRIAQSHRRRIAILKGGFAALRAVEQEGDCPFALTSIAADNAPARRVLEAGLSGLPIYRPAGSYVTRMMRTGGRRIAPDIMPARAGDLPEVAAFLHERMARRQVAPAWDAGAMTQPGLVWMTLRQGGTIAGVIGVWDQRASRQAVLRGMPPAIARVRRIANLAAPMLRLPAIPAPGQPIAQAFLTGLAVMDDDPELALALTAAGIAHAARIGAQVATIGLPAGHAWLAPVRRRFRAIEYQTQLHIAYWPEAAPAVAALDPAPAFPDVALL